MSISIGLARQPGSQSVKDESPFRCFRRACLSGSRELVCMQRSAATRVLRALLSCANTTQRTGNPFKL